MKKTIVIFIVLLMIALWAKSCRNELAVWFNSESFYRPIYESDFGVFETGSTVHAELKPSYDVRYGFFLVFPCESMPVNFFADLDGSIRYTIQANGVELESKTISVPSRPMSGLSSGGLCDIVVFTFDLPFQGYDEVTLDVVLESPITKLASYQNIRCKVAPAYWPK